MAIGFPAYHEETVRFRGVPRANLRRAAEDAIDDIGWTWRREGRWRFVASVPPSVGLMGILIVFWGERLIVAVGDEELWVRSEGSFPLQWLDFGKHQTNINLFLRRVEDFLDD
jgi:hypothetical protein